ncbi:MAG: ABC transporter ATP-binding protein [Defluviicoccus sp.]|nr:ABC transporter ATP-binding protein [Defluviicoccus sp.]MDE0383479.1 ABC transporter ATP-binding protein [Defluviicoccus sp.]
MSLLEIRNLDAFYGDFQALFGLDFDLDEHETVAAIGANGAGKTTLLRAITGMVDATSEALAYRGESIQSREAADIVALGIAMVPEGRRLFPSLSVEENLIIGGHSGRPGRWSLDRVYELFPALRNRRAVPGTALSGGEQQMTAIGRALMSNPDLILFDELSLGLAPVVVGEIYEVLPAIKAEGTAMVVVEQDINRALDVADRVYCLQEGRLALTGAPASLTRDRIAAAYFGT